MRLERDYQARLIKTIKQMFKGCVVLKNDSNYLQGIPDLLIIHKDKWAALEVKRDISEMDDTPPNQFYYVDYLNEMSFAAFIYPQNEEDVLDALQFTLEPSRTARFSRR